jgi:hypothetical protein
MKTSTSGITTQHLVYTIGLDEVGRVVFLGEIQSLFPMILCLHSLLFMVAVVLIEPFYVVYKDEIPKRAIWLVYP